MKILKTILTGILALWALVTFVATFLIIFIPAMLTWLLPDPFGQKMFIIIARIWMRVWLTLVGCPVWVYGRENFKKGETYIVTCNHNSFMDVPLSCPFIPGANKTIAKKDFVKVPLFGWYYLKGSVIVDRKSDESRRQSYEKMKAVLKKKMHMSVYPEGTRNRTTEPLKKFHGGAFRLSAETGNAIIPCVIFYTKIVLPAGAGFSFRPHKLEMHYLPAVSPTGKTSDELKDEVFETMKAFYISRLETGK